MTEHKFQEHAIFPIVFNTRNFDFVLEKIAVIGENAPACVFCSFAYPEIDKKSSEEIGAHLAVFWSNERGYIYFDPSVDQYVEVYSGQQLYHCLSHTAVMID